MSELSKLTKADKKALGIVDTPQGIMVDKKRLIEIKKYQRKDKDDPKKEMIVKKVKVEDMIKQTINQSDEARGIY